MQNKSNLKYSDRVREIIIGLTKKYRVEIDLSLDLSERIKIENPRVAIFKATEIILEESENGEKIAVDRLKNDLKINQKDAEKLLEDIKKEIVPLAELQFPEEIDEIKGEDENKEEAEADYDKEKYRQDLLRKISPNSVPIKETEEILPPKVKNPEITDVENNAEKIQHTQKREAEEKSIQKEEKKVDAYKEPIE